MWAQIGPDDSLNRFVNRVSGPAERGDSCSSLDAAGLCGGRSGGHFLLDVANI